MNVQVLLTQLHNPPVNLLHFPPIQNSYRRKGLPPFAEKCAGFAGSSEQVVIHEGRLLSSRWLRLLRVTTTAHLPRFVEWMGGWLLQDAATSVSKLK